MGVLEPSGKMILNVRFKKESSDEPTGGKLVNKSASSQIEAKVSYYFQS